MIFPIGYFAPGVFPTGYFAGATTIEPPVINPHPRFLTDDDRTFKVSQGADADWLLTILEPANESEGTPYLGFVAGDDLEAELWSGQDQAVLFAPTVEWESTPDTGLYILNISATQSAQLSHGRYRIRVKVITSDGRTIPVLNGILKATSSPSTGTPPKVYGTYADLLAYAPFLDTLEDVDSDLSGFARQRASARRYLDQVILAHVRPNVFGCAGRTIALNYASNDPTVKGWLEDDKLVLTDQVVEIVSRHAIALVLESLVDDQYQRIANDHRRRADALLGDYVAEFDPQENGPPYYSVPCHYVSSRVPTPTRTGWRCS